MISAYYWQVYRLVRETPVLQIPQDIVVIAGSFLHSCAAVCVGTKWCIQLPLIVHDVSNNRVHALERITYAMHYGRCCAEHGKPIHAVVSCK